MAEFAHDNEKGASDMAPTMQGSAPAGKTLTAGTYAAYDADDLNKIADEHNYTDHTGLVVDIEEARKEYGDEIANKLKLAKDGRTILWPQPTNRPDDPQNWSDAKKNFLLLIITMAAFVPDFISSCGIASLFPLAAQFDTTTDHINNLTSNWSILMLGIGGMIWVFFIKRFGRLPCMFWSQFIGLGFTIGCTVAPTLSTFAAMRILAATFQTAPQVSGLYTICDLFPFHLQARKINLWTLGFVVSPFVGPSFLGFVVGQGITWRWVYGIGCIYSGLVLVLIVLFMEETMFDRHVRPIPPPPSTGMRYRIETLIGITGLRMAKYRPSWFKCVSDTFTVVWKPQILLPLLYVMWVFGFGIGINVTNAVFVGSPPPLGYGLTANQQAGSYFSPIIGCLLGEFTGRYLNDYVARRGIKRNHGVFESEMRLWTLYIALPFFVGGFLLLGYSFQDKLNFAAAAIGWVMAEFSILVTTVCVYAYCLAAEPHRQGEVSSLINFFRVLGGFAVPYFQIEWSLESGTAQVFGVEAAIVVGMFFLIVPLLQWKGKAMRQRFPAATARS